MTAKMSLFEGVLSLLHDTDFKELNVLAGCSGSESVLGN